MNNFKSTSPTDLILSSLVSEFRQGIQIKTFLFGGEGGGGGKEGGERYEHESRLIFYTQHIVMTDSTEPYSFMKVFPTVFRIDREHNSKSIKARVVILVHDTSSWPVHHNCKVSWYTIGYSSYGADMKSHLKESWGNNSESMKGKVVILVRDTPSWPVLHNCEVSLTVLYNREASSKYSERYSSYWADTKMFVDGRTDRRRTDASLIALSPEPSERG